jgi:O-antigen/teichoic acid export membrane protein
VPPSSSRARMTPRRSPRAVRASASVPDRPLVVPFAVAFGLLMALEVLYLGYLLWEPAPAFDWYLVVPVVVAAVAVAGSLLVLRGRPRAWMLLAGAAVVLVVALLVLVFILGALGATAEMWSAVLLTTGPIGCLVLATRRPVREWTRPDRATRSPGGQRSGGGGR